MAVNGRALAVLLLASAMPATAQDLFTYTNDHQGAREIALGYPVPLPVESLTPVDGFRSYDSLNARHQALALDFDFISAHRIGRTIEGRRLWAYTISDGDQVTAAGFPEPAFLINGGIHAREWQSPEVVTGIMERFAQRGRDGALYQYLVENSDLVVIPVLNVDGFLQTQRFPKRVIIGGDPTDPSWPRDGRMRRKNMRNADEKLLTLADYLHGVDLNRNNPPFAPSTIQASSNPDNLVFHGNGAQNQPETRALAASVALAPHDRLRLYTDFHSFAAAFFDPLTANSRQNAIQGRLISRAIGQIASSGTIYSRTASNTVGIGIGSTDEYFAHVYQVPAWTLELEPNGNLGGRQYGGFGANHDGFILPDSQIARVRREIADAYALLFYAQSGPPSMQAVRVLDDDGSTVYGAKWVPDGPGRRRLQVNADRPLLAGAHYRLWIAFDKPMRVRGADGEPAHYPGAFLPVPPELAISVDGERQVLDTPASGWRGVPDAPGEPGYLRYRYDAYVAGFTAPEPSASPVHLEITVPDLADQALDADPATAADWSQGHWVNYENSGGTPGDSGGTDATLAFAVARSAEDSIHFQKSLYRAVEGDAAAVAVVREGEASGPLEATVTASVAQGDLVQLLGNFQVSFAGGETGVRTIMVPVPENYGVGPGFPSDDVGLAIHVDSGSAVVEGEGAVIEPVDNDTPERSVANLLYPDYQLAPPGGDTGEALTRDEARGVLLCDAFSAARNQASPVAMNMGDNVIYELDAGLCNSGQPSALGVVTGSMMLDGHASSVRVAGGAAARLLEIGEDGALDMRGVILEGGRSAGEPGGGAILNRGVLTADGVTFRDNLADRGGALENRGAAEVLRSAFLDNDAPLDGGAVFNAGDLRVSGVTLSGNAAQRNGGALFNQGMLVLGESTLIDNDAGGGADLADAGTATLNASVLASAGACLQVGAGSIQSDGDNLDAGASCGLQGATDLVSLDPRLEPPGEFGRREPGPTSPLVDARQLGGACPGRDMAGVPRPFGEAGGLPRCDIGAAERGLAVHRGMWWNPERPGHGIDLEQSGNVLFVTWFTYSPDGSPVWYQAAAPFGGPHWTAELLRYGYDFDGNSAVPASAGSVSLDFDSGDRARFGWDLTAIGQGTGAENFQPLIFADGSPVLDATGHWAAADGSGWGVTVDMQGGVDVATLYYYDPDGNPRWVQGVGDGTELATMAMRSFTGFCPGCDPAERPVSSVPAGRVELTFLTRRDARIEAELVFPRSQGDPWQRSVTLFPLSDPLP